MAITTATETLNPRTWLYPTPRGLYCEPGDFYIDPAFAVPRAVITHGHGDHARPGHRKALATPETLAIMRTRFQDMPDTEQQALKYGESVRIGDVEVGFAPAVVAEPAALGEEIGVVEAGDIAGFGAGREAVTELVEAVPVGLGGEVGDGGAALAAEGAVAAENGGSRRGQRAAVEAGAVSVCHVRSLRRRGRGS